jgi:DNA-binding IclR family transcriptional regulator
MAGFPPEVIAFAALHINSLEDLQVLLSCLDARDRWWDASGMARELGISVSAARRSLDRLARGNLLDIRIRDDVRYQFKPGTAAIEAAAVRCAAAYRADPIAMVQLVTGCSYRSVRDFADAFRIRRDDDDG